MNGLVDIILSAAIFLLAAAVLIGKVHKRKKKGFGCGCGCSSCGASCSREKEKRTKSS